MLISNKFHLNYDGQFKRFSIVYYILLLFSLVLNTMHLCVVYINYIIYCFIQLVFNYYRFNYNLLKSFNYIMQIILELMLLLL